MYNIRNYENAYRFNRILEGGHMEDLIQYLKGNDNELDKDFLDKKKFGDVYFCARYLYSKKGMKWFYYPVENISSIEMINGSRQLRQCCGAPIYKSKMLLITTLDKERIYLNVEETNNGDKRRTEALIEEMKNNISSILFIS